MEENNILITKAFREVRGALAPYVVRELNNEYGDRWYEAGIYGKFYEDQRAELPQKGDMSSVAEGLDVLKVLQVFDYNWNDVFKKKLSIDYRNWAKELIGCRHKLAHLKGTDFNDSDTWRALDTMTRLCEQIDNDAAETIRKMLYDFKEKDSAAATPMPEPSGQSESKSAKEGILTRPLISGLHSWREVMVPHPDVAQGRYRNAEFAADLAQVARGAGGPEYCDPAEFFARTYITGGMGGLLKEALKRVTGGDGEPVVQLKTAFGGGKTHSMLALYHMLRGGLDIEKAPGLKPLLEETGLSSLPRANIAVIVGTALDPSKSRRPSNLRGNTVNTLWGEMAAQLVAGAGRPELYEIIKESDKKGTSPGSEALRRLFDECGPCLVLIDELVAYARKLFGARETLPAGTFENIITFIQEITEGARASRDSIVVASLPESDIEIGGEAGSRTLEMIEQTFGRMESIWRPVQAEEGFEVVRRRLFLPCSDNAERDSVCEAFSTFYREHSESFPFGVGEQSYNDRLKSSYPIHPEFFDRLYNDWATLEKFQRTRGVLRLMAAVIHELWMGNDSSLMIMPGSIPLSVPAVRDELTRYLPEQWSSIVDSEVDGENSVPYLKDKEVSRYGSKHAARRVARTIMLGSAPSSVEQVQRGIEMTRVRLGAAQPGESVADFNDAAAALRNSLVYLYSNSANDRLWFDTRPTLRRTVDDRARQISDETAEAEIKAWLYKSVKRTEPFSGVHICPSSSLDVPDEQSVRLVLMSPGKTYRRQQPETEAEKEAAQLLNSRGDGPRIHRNMLAFVAPDTDVMLELRTDIKKYLAWKSIERDKLALNLDQNQEHEMQSNITQCRNTINTRLAGAYCWLFTPVIDREHDLSKVVWEIERISGQDDITKRAAQRMISDEKVISEWAPLLLKKELDGLLWKESPDIPVKQLWNSLTQYCYLPRLADYSVLTETIKRGLCSKDFFALASDKQNNKYIGLKFDTQVTAVEKTDILVKPENAMRQLLDEQVLRANENIPGSSSWERIFPADRNGGEYAAVNPDHASEIQGTSRVERPKNCEFSMQANIDNMRIVRTVQQLVDEVLTPLISDDGTEVEISLEIHAKNPCGISVPTVRTVEENCTTLKVKFHEFSD